MKKRIYAILLLALVQAGSVFGADFSMSAGAGALAGGFFTRYNLSADGSSTGGIEMDAKQNVDQFNYGFLAFLDATYGVLSVSYQRGNNNYWQTANTSVIDNFKPMEGKGWESMLGITLLLKYPFRLNEKLTLFPLAGLEYQICLRQQRTQPNGWVYDRDDGEREKDKDGKAFSLSDWNVFWIHIGGGADITLSETLFLRGELLCSIRTMTGYESKNLDLVKQQTQDNNPSTSGLTIGPSLRVSVGYRFYTK